VGVVDDDGAVRKSIVDCGWHPNQVLAFDNVDKAMYITILLNEYKSN